MGKQSFLIQDLKVAGCLGYNGANPKVFERNIGSGYLIIIWGQFSICLGYSLELPREGDTHL